MELKYAARRPGGFAVIELLVVITILAVLIAIVVPSLGKARERAMEARSLAGIRTCATAFFSYSDRYQGANPWTTVGAALSVSPPGDGETTIASSEPFVLQYAWPALFHDVAPWEENYAVWRNDRARGQLPWLDESGGIVWPAFAYCRSLQARPAVWGTAALADPLGEHRSTRLAEIAFPSSKAILFDRLVAYQQSPRAVRLRPVAAADGSAEVRADHDAKPVVANQITLRAPEPYHDTVGGVDGVDF